jgi:hypothetical protein
LDFTKDEVKVERELVKTFTIWWRASPLITLSTVGSKSPVKLPENDP